MRLLAVIIAFGLLTTNELSHACTIAPSYLPHEFGSNEVALGNIVKRANKIVLGKFSETDRPDKLNLHISKSFKPEKKFFFRRKQIVSFNKVQQTHFISGLDEREFTSETSLFSFIETFRPFYKTNPSTNIEYGTSGVVSGIFHGTDCERFVIMHSEQPYLTFLNEKNIIMARLAINKKAFGDLKTTLEKLDNVLAEYNP